MRFTSTDLKLAFHDTTMYINGSLNNGAGNLSITIKDYYDFKNEEYKAFGGLSSAVTAINDMAWGAQEIGTIGNYWITVTFDYNVN